MLELVGLTKRFDGKPAISDVSLTVEGDEYLTLLGPSGSGKSTLLRVIAGLEWPDEGAVLLNGQDITGLPTYRRGLGIVQQNYALFTHLSVFENVAFGLRYREVDPVSDPADIDRRVARILNLVGLDGLEGRMVGQISGGQKQRVSLARTLVTEPKICLLDEPLGALDANLRERMTLELRRIREVLGVTFLHVTGNETEALAMGDRMIVFDEGRALMVDAPDTVFARPATVRVASFLNAYNLLPGSVTGSHFLFGDAAFPVPPEAANGAHYAVRYDTASIAPAHAAPPEGHVAMRATFVASEFMGSRVVYFLRRADGGIFEVDRHLSVADPVDYRTGQDLTLHWPPGNALVFGATGALIWAGADRAATLEGAR